MELEIIINAIRSQFNPHKEVCGIVTGKGKVHQIKNVANSPTDFVFSKNDYYSAVEVISKDGDSIRCIYHTHLSEDPTPSKNDLASIRATGHDYLIVTMESYTYTEYDNARS